MSELLLVVDDRTRAHLARALESHRLWCRVNAVPMPPLLLQFAGVLAASGGQERPQDAEPLPPGDSGPVLLAYGDAGRLLSVSERTVRRLVSSGELGTVSLGGCKRIARTELDRYVKEKTDGADSAA